jgi:hypothetical protein
MDHTTWHDEQLDYIREFMETLGQDQHLCPVGFIYTDPFRVPEIMMAPDGMDHALGELFQQHFRRAAAAGAFALAFARRATGLAEIINDKTTVYPLDLVVIDLAVGPTLITVHAYTKEPDGLLVPYTPPQVLADPRAKVVSLYFTNLPWQPQKSETAH